MENTSNVAVDSNIISALFLEAEDNAAKESAISLTEIERVALVTKFHEENKKELKIFELKYKRSLVKKFNEQISKSK